MKIGIADYDQMKARTMAIARGERTPAKGEPKVWFTSIESFARLLSEHNRHLLELIAHERPRSLTELAELAGRSKSNLSRTLKTVSQYGLPMWRDAGGIGGGGAQTAPTERRRRTVNARSIGGVFALAGLVVSGPGGAQEIINLPGEDRHLELDFEELYRVGSVSGEDFPIASMHLRQISSLTGYGPDVDRHGKDCRP